MNSPIDTLSLRAMAAQLADGTLTSSALTAHFSARIEALNPTLNAFVTVLNETAATRATWCDNNALSHTLSGIPMAHKDIFCTQGVRTTCGSRMLENFIAPYDATVVTKLNDCGAVMLGKTNMDEFAMGSSNENSFYGAVRNPWDLKRVPGGSSGGSAAAVAAGMVAYATGTDTGGSVRQPAAFCGITGLKPTYGRVSRFGMVAFASSLDQAGILARSADDAALVLQAMSGFDPADSTCADEPVDNYSPLAAANASESRPLRIGLPKQFFTEGTDRGVRERVEAALDVYRAAGAQIVTVDLPHLSLSVPVYYVIAPAECSSNLSRFDGVRFGHRCADPQDLADLYRRSRTEGFGDEVIRRILTGTYVLSAGYYDAYYRKAQQVRRLIADDFAKAFASVDVLMGPTAPTTAFGLGDNTDDPVTMYLNDIFTLGVSLAGLPAMSVPCGLSDGLPVGLQIIAPHFAEAHMIKVAHQLQTATDWHLAQPSTVAGAGA